jgi:medium-chain acyl-[acyl-carrier-protein] hydrolase
LSAAAARWAGTNPRTRGEGTESAALGPGGAPRVRLLCLPYAGGSAALFHSWQGSSERFSVQPVELPGRGRRFSERPLSRLDALVGRLGGELLPGLQAPYALFGHSMGALLAFELARWLGRNGGPKPAYLFVSGCRAPQSRVEDETRSSLSDGELINELRRLNGTDPEILGNAELMALLLPVFRADFAVCESYQFEPGPPLGCPITAFGGIQDTRISCNELDAWRVHTSGDFSLQMLPGDHFFLHAARSSIQATLARCLESVPPLSA